MPLKYSSVIAGVLVSYFNLFYYYSIRTVTLYTLARNVGKCSDSDEITTPRTLSVQGIST